MEVLDEGLKQFMDGDGQSHRSPRPAPLSWRRVSTTYLRPLVSERESVGRRSWVSGKQGRVYVRVLTAVVVVEEGVLTDYCAYGGTQGVTCVLMVVCVCVLKMWGVRAVFLSFRFEPPL